ncbi:tRNA pseudouridine(38-40) synthase TruA [Bombilactobacillus folatiphilus]|uniref:tRNA pseudouridine synthase A n=1 Tax=Bombilactobacillus folatiphilus TaxID=2923362 RepID=A0ABY4P9J7_9LACO|nr:tRNA pseudouridine(38-40) synthase TruA [Bombilactobacillus folatiphilus]UQS82384.1 tRNA pseudouridine(38-40) synthase TruA [Bombilactobacillus folatiphilus]
MTTYKITMAYDGTNYHGFARQPHLATIQGTVERALLKMSKGLPVEVVGSGRTDAGVHALGQVISFNYPGNISADKMVKALNSLMPLDILFKQATIVPADFNARFDTVSKIYEYRVSLDYYTDPFDRLYTGHYSYSIDLDLIKIALQDVVGVHDFTSFEASGGVIKDKVREIYQAEVVPLSDKHQIIFLFHGNGFLYNMVRIMVAVLLEIGSGRRAVHDFRRLYQVKDRQQARWTAPASGLYLKQVFYDN